MRLINNETMALEEFMGGGIHAPEYAILSHTWEDGELSLQEFSDPNKKEQSRNKKGYTKIKRACELAKVSGIKYTWVDTCCIDKSSSAELTEAINSMFHWYRGAIVCYVWLADLLKEKPNSKPQELAHSPFEHCRWFTRGWTLQELIAPRRVEFYDQDWNFRGTKMDLCEQICEITKIGVEVLDDPQCLPRLSVAHRMSWVSTRQTTRVEDMAYCLLGIFDVNMPMLYGEGERAFLRLQEEIAKNSNDLSLFAWRANSADQAYRGVFADRPAEFRNSGGVKLTSDTIFNPEFSITNKGIRVNLDLYSSPGAAFLLKLNCSQPTDDGPQQIGIWVTQHGGGVYGRTNAQDFAVITPGVLAKPQHVFLFKTISADRSRDLEGSHNNAFMLRKGFNNVDNTYSPEFPFEAIFMQPAEEWDSQRRMFLTHGASEFTGYGNFFASTKAGTSNDLMGGESFLLVFGIAEGEKEPWVTIASGFDGAELFHIVGHSKKLAVEARKREGIRSILTRNKDNCITHQVTVTLEKELISGLTVWCIDLHWEAAEEENVRGELLTTMWANREQYAKLSMGL